MGLGKALGICIAAEFVALGPGVPKFLVKTRGIASFEPLTNCDTGVDLAYTFGVPARNHVVSEGEEPAPRNGPFSVKPSGHIGWVTTGTKASPDLSSRLQGRIHQEG